VLNVSAGSLMSATVASVAVERTRTLTTRHLQKAGFKHHQTPGGNLVLAAFLCSRASLLQGLQAGKSHNACIWPEDFACALVPFRDFH